MQTFRIAAAHHQTARELVHDDHLIVLDDVVDIALHQVVGLECLIDVVIELSVLHVREVLHAERLFRLGDAVLRQIDGFELLVYRKVFLNLERLHKTVNRCVHVGALIAHAGDDQRRTRLVDQYAVHLVHHGKAEIPLHHALLADHHVVAQVVEAEFVVGTVNDVAGVIGTPLLRRYRVYDEAHGITEKCVKLSHPLRVSLGQIVVDGDDVHALTGERVETHRQRGDQRFTFARLHLGDAPLMEYDAADDLYIEVPHTEHTVRSFPHLRKHLGQQVVQRFTVRVPLAEFRGLGLQFGIAQSFVFVFQLDDGIRNLAYLLDFAFIAPANHISDQSHSSSPILEGFRRSISFILPSVPPQGNNLQDLNFRLLRYLLN